MGPRPLLARGHDTQHTACAGLNDDGDHNDTHHRHHPAGRGPSRAHDPARSLGRGAVSDAGARHSPARRARVQGGRAGRGRARRRAAARDGAGGGRASAEAGRCRARATRERGQGAQRHEQGRRRRRAEESESRGSVVIVVCVVRKTRILRMGAAGASQ